MKCKLTKKQTGEDGKPLAAGTEISHPKAWRLVLVGVAEPSDEECVAFLASRKKDEAGTRPPPVSVSDVVVPK